LAIPAPNRPSGAGQPSAGRDVIGNLLDDMGVESTPTGGKRCPNCNAIMAGHAIFCVECGFDLQTQETVQGSELQNQSDNDQPATKSYGNPVLDKAAKELEYDKREKRVSQDPRSWYTYFIGLLFVAVFIAVGAIISLKAEAERDKVESDLPEPMEAIFYGTLTIGILVILYPWGQITYTGFKKGGTLQGSLCLTLVYAPVCAIMFWKDLKRAFGMWVFGFLLLALSLILHGNIGDEADGGGQSDSATEETAEVRFISTSLIAASSPLPWPLLPDDGPWLGAEHQAG